MPTEQVRYDILSAAFHASPNATLDRMRTEDPVYWHPDLQCWVVTRYDDVQMVIRDPRFSVEKGGDIAHLGASEDKIGACNDAFSTWMVFADPPQHTKLRSVVAKILSPQVTNGLQSRIEQIADDLLDAVQAAGRMEIVRDLALPLPAFVVADLLGVPREKTPDLKRWSNDMFALFGSGGILTPALIDRVHESVLACRAYFQELIEQRREQRGGDVISQLLGTDLNDEQILATAQMIMVGSNETTTYLTVNAVLALLEHPKELQRLSEDPGLMDLAVEELIRFTGPALSIGRRALVDVQVGSSRVSAGQIVCCMLHAGNFDPERFEEPHTLDVGRTGNRHLGLGYGIHFCVGAGLTRLETKIALRALIRRFTDLRVEGGERTWIPNLAVRGLQSLPIAFRVRATSELHGLGSDLERTRETGTPS